MSIQSPRLAKGGHGDLVSALVLAVWKAVETTAAAPAPKPGTHEAFEAEALRMEKAMEREYAARGDAAWKQRDVSSWRSRFGR
jgi:hypothetical protein